MIAKKYFRFLENVRSFMQHPIQYLSTFIQDPSLKMGGIYCVMCGYNEFENVEGAIQGIVDVADRLIFVDKNGALKDQVLSFRDEIDIDYFIKPELNLLESRSFAVDLVPTGAWVLVVDADEIVLVSRSYFLSLMTRKVGYRSKMNITHNDFEGIYAMNDFHPFLLYNGGGIYFNPPRDVPRFEGRQINLSTVCKENRAWSKDERHLYYRKNFWTGWQSSEIFKGKPIEEYIISIKGELPSDEVVKNWNKWITSRGKQV